jgi:hypothetical protein
MAPAVAVARATRALAYVALVGMVAVVMAPWFEDTSTFGFHDRDVETSFRYLTIESLLRHHEFPGFNPYACGGYPLWGYVEGATNLVSPWFPAYLLLPLSLAIRVEVVGMALLGAVGAYTVAGAFTKSAGPRLVVAALWAVNGRWGLQTASGHTWHLAYAYMPWCLWFFERARVRDRRLRDLVGLGVSLAMLLYSGGIYPLPHTILALGGYALICTFQERTLRPLHALFAGGLLAMGLAAPKLIPLLATFSEDPRHIVSTETLDLGAFVTLLTHPEQHFYARPARVRPYGWHEWGMYIGAIGAALLALAVVFVEGRRERALKAVGLTFLALGFGAFHPWAPWTLLHEHVPVFRSQHVPSRFLYPAVLLLALPLAAGLGRLVRRRRWLDLALTLGAGWLALDIASVAQQPMRDAMWMVPPPIPEGRDFHHERQPPFHYEKRDWAGPMLLSMMANTGVLDCYGVPRREGWQPHALAVDDAHYRSEAYVEGSGRARIEAWSPNRVRIALESVEEDSMLVYNMHFGRGWRAELEPGGSAPVVAHAGLLAVRIPRGTERALLSYRPPGLPLGLVAFGLSVLFLYGLWRLEHRGDNDPGP